MRQFILLKASVLIVVASILLSCRDESEKRCSICPEPDPVVMAAKAYVNERLVDYGLRERIDALDVLSVNSFPDSFDRVNFYQTYRGVHVTQGYLSAKVNKILEIESVDYEVVTGIDIDTKPKISGLFAKARAIDLFEEIARGVELVGNGELAVYRIDGTDFLSWHYILRSTTTMTMGEYYIDARTGELLEYHIAERIH